ncbi:MAG TPA: transcription antitermination factor NusB [Methylophilaceae bacterium]|nr:transcription antitermination factor NusB [Methylophilaceae bacterium]
MMDDDKTSSASRSGKPSKNRRKSRELALKGIYRKFLNDLPVSQLVRDLKDDPDFERADEEYFQQLMEGVSEHLPELDERLAQFIDRGIPELSPIEHGILCIAAYELIYDPSIPYRVAINEGVELAKRFGGTDGHKYVNGVLDKLAAEARPAEFARTSR